MNKTTIVDTFRISLSVLVLFVLSACAVAPVPSGRNAELDTKRENSQSIVVSRSPAFYWEKLLSASGDRKVTPPPKITEKRTITSRLSVPEKEFVAPIQPSPIFPEKPEKFLGSKEETLGREGDAVIREGDAVIREDAGPKIPMVLNKRVRWFIKYFKGPHRKNFEKYLIRSGRYSDLMRKILREEGVPEDLFYIAMIESGFNPRAYSKARATGIWQFMKATAKRYGLKINGFIDERRDPEKSTRAAARYFRDLHQVFRSWDLAQAGYNAGEGRVRRGLRRLNRLKRKKDFWSLAKARYISRETRNFVPKFIAAAIIGSNPEAHGFKNLNYEKPRSFEKVHVPKMTRLVWITEKSGVSMEDIKDLNPALKVRRGWTPSNYHNYILRVPPGTSGRVVAAVKSFSKAALDGRKYKVGRGDTLSGIAAAFGTSLARLVDLNGINDPNRINIGDELILPGDSRRKQAIHAFTETLREGSDNRRSSHHVVNPGDTIWHLSKRYKIKMKNLLAWNQLSKDGQIRPGDKVLLSPP